MPPIDLHAAAARQERRRSPTTRSAAHLPAAAHLVSTNAGQDPASGPHAAALAYLPIRSPEPGSCRSRTGSGAAVPAPSTPPRSASSPGCPHRNPGFSLHQLRCGSGVHSPPKPRRRTRAPPAHQLCCGSTLLHRRYHASDVVLQAACERSAYRAEFRRERVSSNARRGSRPASLL
jgi:hypothetical protein